MNLPVEVIDAVRAGRCLVFVGTRASMEAAELADEAYPDAAALAKELGWKRPKVPMGGKQRGVIASVAEGAAEYESAHGRAALVARLGERVGAPVAPTEAHRVVMGRFPVVFTTALDDLLERASTLPVDVIERGARVPDPVPDRRVLVKIRGGFDRPDTLVLTPADSARKPLSVDAKKQLRGLIRNHVVLFVGYRPDEEEFESLFAELSDAWGGELPRCHLSVAQGPIDDFLWQKWVWRGLLMFTADPVECMHELQASVA